MYPFIYRDYLIFYNCTIQTYINILNDFIDCEKNWFNCNWFLLIRIFIWPTITSLDRRLMNFLGVVPGPPEKRYPITGVSLEVVTTLHWAPWNSKSWESHQRIHTNQQVDDLVSDHIASHILIQNSFIPALQVSILKWKSWQENIKQH